MQAVIKAKGVDKFLRSFIIPKILLSIRAKLSVRRLLKYQDVFDIKSFQEILYGSNFLHLSKKGEGTHLIQINPTIKLSDGKLFVDCCRTINFGCLNASSYPVFDGVFKSFQEDFWLYYKYFGGMTNVSRFVR